MLIRKGFFVFTAICFSFFSLSQAGFYLGAYGSNDSQKYNYNKIRVLGLGETASIGSEGEIQSTNMISKSSTVNDFGAGLQIGYDFNFTIPLMLAIEFNSGYVFTSGGSGGRSINVEDNFHTSLLLKAGYKFRNIASLYLMGGAGYSLVKLGYANEVFISDKAHYAHFVFGAGTEFKPINRLGLFVEYKFFIPQTSKDILVGKNLGYDIANLEGFKLKNSQISAGFRFYF